MKQRVNLSSFYFESFSAWKIVLMRSMAMRGTISAKYVCNQGKNGYRWYNYLIFLVVKRPCVVFYLWNLTRIALQFCLIDYKNLLLFLCVLCKKAAFARQKSSKEKSYNNKKEKKERKEGRKEKKWKKKIPNRKKCEERKTRKKKKEER